MCPTVSLTQFDPLDLLSSPHPIHPQRLIYSSSMQQHNMSRLTHLSQPHFHAHIS